MVESSLARSFHSISMIRNFSGFGKAFKSAAASIIFIYHTNPRQASRAILSGANIGLPRKMVKNMVVIPRFHAAASVGEKLGVKPHTPNAKPDQTGSLAACLQYPKTFANRCVCGGDYSAAPLAGILAWASLQIQNEPRPTGAMWNRHGGRLTIAHEFGNALDQLRSLSNQGLEWAD